MVKDKINLEKLKEDIEEAIGEKLPPGCCLCRLKDGRAALIYTSEVPEEVMETLSLNIFLRYGEGGRSPGGNIRDYCTGDYIKTQ